MSHTRLAALIVPGLCLIGLACWSPAATPPASPRLRHPIAAAYLADGRTLCVANRRRGTVSLVDVPRSAVIGETAVGQRLSDLAVHPDGKHLLVTDDRRHELIVLHHHDHRLHIRARVAVGPYPASVSIEADGRRALVASTWSRQAQVIDLAPLGRGTGLMKLRILHTIPLPFPPGQQCALPDGSRVVITDAFGGHLAVLDTTTGRLTASHQINGHNLRGLAISADNKSLLLAHQILDQKVPTTRKNLEQGKLIANVLRLVPIDALLDPKARLDEVSRLVRLDTPGTGAGDPSGVAPVGERNVAVMVAGTNEAALVRLDGKGKVQRIKVGRRPSAVVPGGLSRPLVVVNTFGDSLSLLDPARGLVTGTVSLGKQPPLTSAERGERLFFDARLSLDGSLSCHSCHTDGHSNGLLADTTGDNTHGTPKRVLTLMNTALTDLWAWNGQMKTLQDQVHRSLAETMHSRDFSYQQVDDLVSFLHTLPAPPPPRPDPEDEEDRERIDRGRRLFTERGCVRCHIPPLTYTSHTVYDVGLADEKGLRKFNPPSLRGVGQGYRFFHDNRAASLEEVFTKYKHKVGNGLAPEDLADLLRFLRSL
jgi:DNA-binding beta-propeller fold protein YncE